MGNHRQGQLLRSAGDRPCDCGEAGVASRGKPTLLLIPQRRTNSSMIVPRVSAVTMTPATSHSTVFILRFP